MKQSGLAPRRYRDHRRYDFHRTFKKDVRRALGAVGGNIPDFVLPAYSNPNQNEPDPYWPREALPEGCTGFAQAHIAEADLKKPVDPADVYHNTETVSGKPGQPQTLEDSFRAATIYGVKTRGQTADQALAQRLAPRFEVRPRLGQDWYDAILQALYTPDAEGDRHPVSAGTTWPEEYESIGPDGLQYYSASEWVGGHDHCFIGKKTFSGEERLVDISWNGVQWGNGGVSYFNRQQVNAMMNIRGSDCLTSRILSGEEVKTVWVNMLLQGEVRGLLISLYLRLIALLIAKQPAPAIPPAPLPPPNPTPMPEPKTDVLKTFCTAIMNFEGGQNDPNHINNNPGDFRCSPVGYLAKYMPVRCTASDFAVFPTFELGWEYLEATVHHRAVLHPTWTIRDFFYNYAPPTDRNPTEKYAATVAAACGVPVSTTLAELFG